MDGQMSDEPQLTEREVRQIVRLLGGVADMNAPRPARRQVLLNGLAGIIRADAWAWIISRASDHNDNPAIAFYQHAGYTDAEVTQHARIMQDRYNPTVEYAALNALRLTHRRFTRRWDELVTPERWYAPRNREILEALGFEHVIYCVRVLDDAGVCSGITFKRRWGRPNFSPLELRIAHIVTGEIDWIHEDGNLSEVTSLIKGLSPAQRTVLLLLMEGHDKPEIARMLNRSVNAVKDHVKKIYAASEVHNIGGLFRRYLIGDGMGVPLYGGSARPRGAGHA
jgi:DNA-binding CsgD family transcriptional regulator